MVSIKNKNMNEKMDFNVIFTAYLVCHQKLVEISQNA